MKNQFQDDSNEGIKFTKDNPLILYFVGLENVKKEIEKNKMCIACKERSARVHTCTLYR